MSLGYRFAISILGTVLLLPCAAWGQQQASGQQSSQPSSPDSSGQGQGNSPVQQTAVGPVSPGTIDLSGAEAFSPGSVGEQPNYFLPSLQISGMADSNSSIEPGPQQFVSVERVGGRLAFQHVERHAVTTLDYAGAGVIYNNHSDLDTTLHDFGFTQQYTGPRWTWIFDERASYLPESAFGIGDFGWGGGLGTSLGGALGSNLSELNPSFNPSQSLYSGRGSRVSNNTSLEFGYVASSRASINFAASYGLLHFRTPGAIDTSNGLLEAGYNLALTARDYVNVDYGLNLFRFHHTGESFANHAIDFNYGHRLTGRFAVALGGGPEISTFNHSLSSSATSVSWGAHASMNYRRPHDAFSLLFSRYTSNGGGVLVGARTDRVQFAWSRKLSREWSGSIGPGYGHNQSLAQTTAGGTPATYNSYYFNGSLSRAIGRYMSMFFTYNLEGQNTHNAACTGNSCSSLIRHVFSFGFDWHPRQLVIE